MKCDICGKECGKLFKIVNVSEKISARDYRMGSWASEKEIVGCPDCIEAMNFLDVTKGIEKIRKFKVAMRELCDERNIDTITTSRIENLMEHYLGE